MYQLSSVYIPVGMDQCMHRFDLNNESGHGFFENVKSNKSMCVFK